MTSAVERLDFLQRRPWRADGLPALPRVPTMLSGKERRLLYALARDYAADDAAVVDAGCFLGGSTTALLAGLRDRRQPWSGPPLHSYDLFRVEAYTIPQHFDNDPSVHVGDSFRGRFEANVSGFGVPHVVHEGDITEIGWTGERIDVLFLDVLKTWEINDSVVREFFPSLVPGRSVIIQQDYGWGWLPWIPITMEVMRPSVRFVDGMQWGSHVFLLEDEVPSDLISSGVSGLDLSRKLELVEQAIDHAPERWVRGMLEIARTPLVAERDGRAAGRSDLDRIERAYADEPNVLLCVEYSRQDLETLQTVSSEA